MTKKQRQAINRQLNLKNILKSGGSLPQMQVREYIAIIGGGLFVFKRG